MKILLILCACLFLSEASISQVDLARGLVAYYPFDGNATDASGNGHHGELVDDIAATTDRYGKANSALLFSGIYNYVRIPDNGAFSTPQFSLVIWFKTYSDELQNLVAKRDFTASGTGGAQYQFFIHYPPYPGIGSNIVSNTSTCTDIVASSYLNTVDWVCRNRWHCAVVTFDGARHKIYIDGVLKKDEPSGFSGMLSCNSEVRIGNWWAGHLLPFQGAMDDIRWYNRPLNQQEVTALFDNYASNKNPLDFTSDQRMCYPNSVDFHLLESGMSINGANTRIHWDYGDGNTSREGERWPTHRYNAYGTYNVKVVADYGNNCIDSVSKIIQLEVQPGDLLATDTTVCRGEQVLLRPSAATFEECWKTDGWFDISGYYPMFTADTNLIYKLTAEVKGKNLVVNADFEAGFAGFGSQHTYNAASGREPGTFTVGKDAAAWNPDFRRCTGHPGDTTSMLLVNGVVKTKAVVWSQTMNVEPNTNYGFSFIWQGIASGNIGSLRVRINGAPFHNQWTLSAGACVRHRPSVSWNSGFNSTVTIEIETFSNSDDANGFAIDDIFFGKILTQTDSIRINVVEKPVLTVRRDTTLCAGNSLSLTTTATGAAKYSWSPSAGLSDPAAASPVASPATTTRYFVTATGNSGCVAKDSVLITVRSAQQCSTAEVATGFTAPDTVCVNTPVTIKNTSAGASNYYWNFCVANASNSPVGTNLGNFGFSLAVFVDYAKDGDNWYAFVTNNMPGKLVRLDFGNSLLNTPTAHDFGNLGGVIPDYCEGIQVVKNEGRWYAIIVGDKPVGRVVKVDFGPSLSNDSPVATNWGDVGQLAFPTDLHLFQDGNRWYGLTINAQTSTITRFDFTTSFTNKPTGTNLGNLGNLDYPTGIYAITKDGAWHAFITNQGGSEGNSLTASLTRLDFGNSLLNMPTAVNLGNPGNALRGSRDISIYQSCNEIFGYVVNNSAMSDIVRLNFNNSLTAIPSAVSLGNFGNFSFPHCVSKLFRVENDLYSFVANASNNTITRLKFSGCDGASIASSTAENPPPLSYSLPGVYNINLITDDGLPTQASICRQVVVVSSTHSPLQQKSICAGDSIVLSSAFPTGNQWSTGSNGPSIYVKTNGLYWVKTISAGGCVNIDSFEVKVTALPAVNLGRDTTFCDQEVKVLNASNPGATYLWQNGQTGPTQTVSQSGVYSVSVTKDGCTASDSITLTKLALPNLTIQGVNSICAGGSTDLSATGGTVYTWTPASGLSNPFTANTTASPQITTKYVLTATGQNGCAARDSITIQVTPKPQFSASTLKPVLCLGDTTMLVASGGDRYTWSPAATVSSPSSDRTLAFPQQTTRYKVDIEHDRCGLKDSLFIDQPVVSKPAVKTTKSNDINCFLGEAALSASGGTSYQWLPTTGLSDPGSSRPIVHINQTTTYHVFITTIEGCVVEDSVTVNVQQGADGTGFPVPSAFTPNGDGKNDCFSVKYWGRVSDFSMQLYNRWGELVFRSTDPSQCWDGRYHGKTQPADVFVYLIRAKTLCGEVVRKGTFTLIR